MPSRYIPGLGHQIVDHKGNTVGTFDTQQEMEEDPRFDAHTAHNAYRNKEVDKVKRDIHALKEHEQKNWGK